MTDVGRKEVLMATFAWETRQQRAVAEKGKSRSCQRSDWAHSYNLVSAAMMASSRTGADEMPHLGCIKSHLFRRLPLHCHLGNVVFSFLTPVVEDTRKNEVEMQCQVPLDRPRQTGVGQTDGRS